MPTYTNTKVSFIQHTAEGVALIRPFSCVSGSCSLSTTNLNAIISAEESEFLACLNNYGDGMTLFLTTGANEFDLDNSHTYTLKVKCSDAADFRSVGDITIPAQAFMQGSSMIKFNSNDILILHN